MEHPAKPAAADDAAIVPDTMRAMVRTAYGTADVMHLAQIPVPAVGDNQVLVKVHAAGLDRGTWHVMAGRPLLYRLFAGVRRPRKHVLGLDLAGTVAAVGAAVTRFAVGDEVFGFGAGSFAEYALAPEAKLAHKPEAISFEQAAAVPVSASTALQALRDAGRLQAGQSVLVIGASGGVGSYAVQLATALGAAVDGVASAGKLDLVESLGARHAIDYARGDFADGSRRYDLILDIAGNRPLAVLRKALAPSGTLVIVGGEGGDRISGGIDRQFRGAALSLFTRQRLTMAICREGAADLERLAGFIAAGQVTPSIERSYPLEKAADAMRQLIAGNVRGKLVITI